VVSTRTRDGLNSCKTSFLDGRTILTQNQFGSSTSITGLTSNRLILMIKVLVIEKNRISLAKDHSN
jgi:hypothetical protein